ncbi:ABC transporter permease [Flavihumibacter sp. UBA7668]|uniref:ABC transporter permease n=1 Tax=Flavihumibacter sp. UBA7668 TaxID=1946542 RepID=UPI0025BD7AB2|nr:ABC transporter permease [Flavihumibacter sp. UBA7668]
MIKNYFTIAFRNIRRYGTHSLLNITGLAIALAACLVIFLVLQHERSYDQYHANASRVFQIVKKEVKDGNEEFYSGVAFPARKALSNDFPQVQFTQFFVSNGSQITVLDQENKITNQKFIEETGVFFSEPNFTDFFDLIWIAGQPEILNQPGMVAISRSKAEKYFGSVERAMGKSILFDNQIRLQVAGIFNDPPTNTDFNFQIVPSYQTFLSNSGVWGFEDAIDGWGLSTSNHQVYALIPERTTADQINSQMGTFVKKYYRPEAASKTFHSLHPLKEIHFDTRFGNNGTHVTSKASLNTLLLIGVLILLMACINFVNLSTALAAKRSKEIGIRKVIGGTRSQLRAQLITETFLLVLFSSVIALLLSWIALPYLKYITDIQEKLKLLNPGSFLFLFSVILITSVLSGFYPAFVLSNFKPIAAIKNKINTSTYAGLSLRRILVVLQFSFSQLLVIATIIAISQMSFIRNADLGFSKDATLLLTGSSDSVTIARQTGFRAELKKIPEVQQVSFSFDAPSSDNNWTSNFAFDHKTEDQPFDAHIKMADEAYAETFGLKLLAGTFYSDADSVQKVVINETMSQKLGMKNPQEAIGKTMKLGLQDWLPIVGVVKDFKNNSLRETVKPTIILRTRNRASTYMSQTNIKLKTSNPGKVLGKIEQLWNTHYPEYAFSASFLDESINDFYQQEERLSRLYKVFAILAIIISSLGLYGLISFMAIQKTKEVGIRKVLGASVSNIVLLFSKEFTILILVAFALAAPVAWYLMNAWLQNFVFKITIGWWIFAIAILTSILIAWATVGYKAIRAALANPVTSLKTE